MGKGSSSGRGGPGDPGWLRSLSWGRGGRQTFQVGERREHRWGRLQGLWSPAAGGGSQDSLLAAAGPRQSSHEERVWLPGVDELKSGAF